MKKILKFLFLPILILTMLLQLAVFAEPLTPFIEKWKDAAAYGSNNERITNCIAYDYLSDKTDKFVKLDADGKETARASDPDMLSDNNGEAEGTVTVAVFVPDKINNAVDIVLCDESGREFSLTAYKDNNYIAYANIPQGTYTICNAGIKDDFKGEYPAKCDKNEIVIEPSTASKLEVTISEKQDLTNPSTYTGANEKNDTLQSSDTPCADHDGTDNGIDVDAKSLLKSTIITVSILAILLINYRIVRWYRNRKNTRSGGN